MGDVRVSLMNGVSTRISYIEGEADTKSWACHGEERAWLEQLNEESLVALALVSI